MKKRLFEKIVSGLLCVSLMLGGAAAPNVNAYAMDKNVCGAVDNDEDIILENTESEDSIIDKIYEKAEDCGSIEFIDKNKAFMVNPIYKDVINVNSYDDELINNASCVPTPASVNYLAERVGATDVAGVVYAVNRFEVKADAVSYIRKCLVERQATIVFETKSSYETKWFTLLNEAMNDFEGCKGYEGDALRFVYTMVNGEKIVRADGYTKYTYSMQYHTTYAQEQQLTKKVNEVMQSLELSGNTQYEKIRKIYDYICDNVDYDYSDSTDLQYTAYAALCNGKAVCQGYAILLYRMCKEAGIDARVIAGIGNGGPHGWNIVKLGSYYFNMDATWDGQGLVTTHNFFLKNNNDFNNHERGAFGKSDSAIYFSYKSDEFNKKYVMSNISWNDTSRITSSKVRLINSRVYVYEGQSYTEGVLIDGVKTYNSFFEWSSTNTSVATVSEQGVVTGKKHGNCVINCRINDNVVLSVKVEVKDAEYGQDISSIANTSAGIKVSWKKTDRADKIEVYRKTSTGSYKLVGIVDGSKTAYVDSTANAGTVYIYAVKTVIGDYKSLYSKVTKKIKRLCQPKLVDIQNTSLGVTLSWKTVTGAEGYYVYRKTGTSGYAQIAKLSGNTIDKYIDKTTSAGIKYTYTVKAYSGATSLSSVDSNGKTIVRLGAPKIIRIDRVTGGVNVCWDVKKGATGYFVYRKENNGKYVKIATIKGTNVVTLKDTSVKKGVKYTYAVKAFNGNSTSWLGTVVKSIKIDK